MQSQNLPHLENQTSLVALCRQLPTSRALAAPNSREQIWQATRQGTRLSDTTMASTEAEHQSNPICTRHCVPTTRTACLTNDCEHVARKGKVPTSLGPIAELLAEVDR